MAKAAHKKHRLGRALPLTHKRLKQLLYYDAANGHFVRRVAVNGNSIVGSVAGHINEHGYRIIGIGWRNYRASRLAWFYAYGTWPVNHMDHMNGNRADDRIENLRDVSRAENMENIRVAYKRNKTGYLGVSKHRSKFRAHIKARGMMIRIGLYDTAEEAHAAYLRVKRKLHKGCTI